MKRQAAKYLALTISAIMAVSLAACGDGSDSTADAALAPVEAEPILSELELEILNLETKYNKGEFEQTDYRMLADAYSRAGYLRRQRNMLEQVYRLYDDAEAFASLQGLSVNLEEENDSIRARAQEMQHDLELPEYLDESVNLIDSEDWFLTMMPKLKEGQRNYYLEQNSEPLLYVQVGYTGEGQCFSKVWYTGSGTKRFLSQEGAMIRLVTVTPAGTAEPENGTEEGTDAADATAATEPAAADIQDTATPTTDAPANTEAWNGSFEAWTMDCADGSIIHEQGTMQTGVLTGDYTCNISAGEGSMEAFSLWSSREAREYISYTGAFDNEGKILTEQPSEAAKKKLLEGTEYTDLILYAYDTDGENCLWQGIGAGQTVEDCRFGQEMIGLENRPEYTSYEVTEDMADAANGADTADNTTSTDNTGNTTDGTTGDAADITGSNPQIRIFDGEVQWFDGKYWVSAGSVREMEKQDPFTAYEENHNAGTADRITGGITGNADRNSSSTEDGQNTTGSTGSATGDKNVSSIQKPASTPAPAVKPTVKPTAKPSTGKPAATKPASTPAPTPAPTQAPAQDNHDDGGSNSGGSTGGDSGSSGGSTGGDSGSSGGSTGGDSGSSGGSTGGDSGSSGGSTGGDSGNSGGSTGGGSDVDVEWTPDLM